MIKNTAMIILLLMILILPLNTSAYSIVYPSHDLEITGYPVSLKHGGLIASSYYINNLSFNGSNADIIGPPEYIICNHTPIYAINVLFQDENYSYEGFGELYAVRYDSSIHNYRVESLVRFESLIITDIVQGDNNTFYISAVDSTYPLYIYEEKINISNNQNIQVGVPYKQVIGTRSIIMKLDCNMNIMSLTDYNGFSIKSIDYNPIHNLLAVEGYTVQMGQESNNNETLIVNHWKILLLDATNLRLIHETNKYQVDTFITPPTGIKWSPTGTYLAVDYLKNSRPLIYKYIPEENSLEELIIDTDNASLTSPIFTLTWIGYNNTLLLGNRSTLMLYDISNGYLKDIAVHRFSSNLDLLVCCGYQPIKDMPLVLLIVYYAEYIAQPFSTGPLITESVITGVYIQSYNESRIIVPLNQYLFTRNVYSINLNLQPSPANPPIYMPDSDYVIVYPRPETLDFVPENNTLKITIYFNAISISNMSRIIISTEPGAKINITSPGIHYRNIINAKARTLICYCKPSTYTIFYELPRPENYIGPNGILLRAEQIILEKNETIKLFIDYNHLLGRFKIITPIISNLTVQILDEYNSLIKEINASELYYIAPGKYVVEITSNNPLYLINSSYTMNIAQGELYEIDLSLAQLEIAISKHHKVIVSGPGGSTVIEGVEGTIVLWVIPGEYTIRLIDLESGEENTTTLRLNEGDIAMYDALVYTYTEPSTTTNGAPGNSSLGKELIVGVLLAAILVIGYLRTKH